MYVALVEWPAYTGSEPAIFTDETVPALMRTCAKWLKGHLPEDKADKFPVLDLDDRESVKEWLRVSNDTDDWAFLTIFKPQGPGAQADWVPHVDVDGDEYPTYRETVSRKV